MKRTSMLAGICAAGFLLVGMDKEVEHSRREQMQAAQTELTNAEVELARATEPKTS